MRDLPDARAVLGLPLDATRGEAQRAFRRLAKQTHPDAGGDAAKFRAVAGAWAELAASLPTSSSSPSPSRSRRAGGSSPHVRAYEPAPSRVVWCEQRRTVASASNFPTVLQRVMARRAA